LPVVLYGCETWPLTLREEQRLRLFENRVLRRIFGSETDEVTGEWRRIHNEELFDLCCSPKVILFFGPCIFNNEDKKINQQNAQINSGLIYY